MDERNSNQEKLRIALKQRNEIKEQQKKGNRNDLIDDFRDMPCDELRLFENFYGNVY